MSKSRKAKRNPNRPAPRPAGSPLPLIAALVVAIAVVVAGGIWLSKGQDAGARQPVAVPEVSVSATNPPVPAASASRAFDHLKGRWVRPDGGYVIDIQNVDATGKLDAAYYNPRPIHVAVAQASLAGRDVKVFIELRDANYPGSNYTLTYDAAHDRLVGIYFQAIAQESFDVYFDRLK